jgi:hypothetical protein
VETLQFIDNAKNRRQLDRREILMLAIVQLTQPSYTILSALERDRVRLLRSHAHSICFDA